MADSLACVLTHLPCWNSDAVLLERYVHQRDEAAFAALVSRHGALVLRLCRRILGDAHAADDAFQATFLILVRKAHALKRPDALSAWLYGVARRVALKARGQSSRRIAVPVEDALPDPHPDPLAQLSARELLDILDEEVQRLPMEQRSAFVLCCLEGHTQEEAARMLGWSVGSVKGRLERGRRRLQARLQRRGIALSAALTLIAVMRDRAAANVPMALLENAVRAALHGGVGCASAALADRVLKTILLRKLASVMAVTLTLGLAASATVALVLRGSKVTPEDKTPAVSAASKDAGAGKPQVRPNGPSDALPEKAIARLGTHRLRHGGWIRFTSFTPDGKILVSQGEDGVRLWDAATGRERRYFAPEPGEIWGSTDLSPDGKTLAAALESEEGHIDIWDISSGKRAASFGQGYYALVRFSPDGKWLAVYERSKAWLATVQLWEVASRRRLLSWKAHGGHQVLNLFFSRDARKLFTCAGDGKVRIWDASTGQQLHELTRLDWKIENNSSSRLSFFNQHEALSPDSRLLALVELNEKRTSKSGEIEWKSRISLRDTTTGEQVHLLTCPSQAASPGRAPEFGALTFTPDGKKLLTGGPDSFLRVWNVATGEELQRWSFELGCPWSLALSGDGKTLAAVMNRGNSIQLLDTATGKPLNSFAAHQSAVGFAALTHEGRTAITVAADGALLWDVENNKIRHRLKGEEGRVFSMEFAKDGVTLYMGETGKSVRVFDLSSGAEKRRFPLEQDFLPAWFGALALSPDGKILAVLSSRKTYRLLDTITGRELGRFEAPESILGSQFMADGRSLVFWSGDLKVRIFDAPTGRHLSEYPLPQDLRIGQPRAVNGPSPTFYHAALSPDGRQLAIGNNRHVLPLSKCFLVFKDLATGREIRRLDNLPADVDRLAYSPDGRMLAWGGNTDPTIYLLETSSGRERGRFVGHIGAVLTLAFSPDGERLISGSRDTTAIVWDLGRHSDRRKAPASLTTADLAKLWDNLASEDASRAYEAICKLAAVPNSAIPFLRKHLPPAQAVDAKRLALLISNLDGDDFAARQKTSADLEKLGERALPAYRKSLDSKPSLELRQRLEELQAKAHTAWWDVSGERLRSLRAIEALELAGTKDAREVLESLAAGAEGARLTEQAKAALERLANGRR